MRFDPEETVILASIGRAAGAAAGTLEKSLACTCDRGPCDWEKVVTLAAAHGVLPLLHKAFSACPDAPIPEGTRQEAGRGYYESGARNARLFRELGRVLKALAARKIEVIPLKGAAAAELLWGNIALRTMSDLDLLVREEDLDGAWKALAALGYGRHPGDDPTSSYEGFHHLAPLLDPVSGTVVELHRGLMPGAPPALRAGEIWGRAVPARVAGCDVRALCPEDDFLYQCCHLWAHFLEKPALRTLADLSANLARCGSAFAWERVLSRLGRRAAAIVWLSLVLVKETGVRTPEDGIADASRRQARLGPFRARLLGKLVTNFFFGGGKTGGRVVPLWRIQSGFEALIGKPIPI